MICKYSDLDDSMTVLAAKESVVGLTGAPAANQKWIYKGKVLDNNSILKVVLIIYNSRAFYIIKYISN